MGKQIEKSGKTVDEAIWNGVQEMGLSVDEVNIEIIQRGSLGLLGIGAKPAIVRLTEKSHDDMLDIKSMFESKEERKGENHKQRENAPRQHKIEKERPERIRTEPVKAEKSSVQAELSNGFEEESIADAVHNSNMETETEAEAAPTVYTEEAAANIPAAQFLSDLLVKMGVEAKVLAAETEDSLKLRIDTEAAGVLIGHRGETLDALQYLTLLVANRDRSHNEYTRVSIDTQGYREKREEVLVRLAKSKASTVRASGKPYKFEPMSPYERRIIHSTLQGNSHVTTHSEGTEPHRYVIITSTHSRRPRRHSREY
ncbi:MAG: protein jag [Clostridia bacterium]|nr:protein jag [Clostridia bacterium]